MSDEKRANDEGGPLDGRVRRLWRVVRSIREEFEVEAATRAEALTLIADPHTVVVTKETCTPKDA